MAYFHVRLTPTGAKKLSGDELALDLTQAQLEERFLAPRREGRPVTIRGRSYDWDDIERIAINETAEPSGEVLLRIEADQRIRKTRVAVSSDWYVTEQGRDVTDELITEPPGSALAAPPEGPSLFHVQVRKGWLSTAEAFNLSENEIRERFVGPWLEGRQVVAGSKAWLPTEAELSIYEGPRLSSQQRAFGAGWMNVVQFGEDVTDRFITGAPSPSSSTSSDEDDDPDPRAVAVAYGRDLEVRDAMFGFLRDLGLDPLEWEELVAATGSAMPYSGEAVEQGFRQARAVVVVFSPDDEARLHPDLHDAKDEPKHERDLTGQPRANVILEAGLALATHSDRTIVVEVGDLRPISNLSGRNVVRLDGTTAPLNALAGRLERAGCAVKRDRGDWLATGRFTALAALKRRAIPQSTAQFPHVRLEDDPGQGPVQLQLVSSGQELWDKAVEGRDAFGTHAPDAQSTEEAELLAGFFDALFDWGEAAGEMGPGATVRGAYELGQQLETLRAAGFVVYVGHRHRTLAGGAGPALPWTETNVRVFRIDDPAIRQRAEETGERKDDAS